MPESAADRDTQDAELALTLERAEQAGLRVLLRGKLIAVVIVAGWYLVSRAYPTTLYVGLLAGVVAVIAIFQYRLIGSPWDRWWARYFFITIDVVMIVGAIIFGLPAMGADLPPILAFRIDVFNFVYLAPAIAALSFSPGLVIWAGIVGAAAWWMAFAWALSGMDPAVILDWGDLPQPPTLDGYSAVFLNPNFIGTGSRMQETVALVTVSLILAIAVHRARGIVRARAEAEHARDLVTQTFGQYVPEAVATALIADRGVLAPTRRPATVLFLDIEGFTRLSESQPPERVLSMLNAFFDSVAQVIARNNGVIIQFIGDALMATYNVPLEDDGHAANAVRSAAQIKALVASEAFEGERLQIRLGLNTGEVAAGSVGGGQRQAYTVYGDAVNLAARLEGMNKQHGTRVLMSQSTATAAGDDIPLIRVGTAAVRGKEQPVELYTLADLAQPS